MRLKIPALILLCAAAGLSMPCHLTAGDEKKSAEARKSEPSKKSEPAKASESSKKPESKKRKPSRREAIEAEFKKLNDQLAENRKELDKARESLHTAQKELAAKADAIKSLESKKCESEDALKKANEELKKFKSSDFNKLAHTLDAERKKNAALQSELKETRKKAEEAIAKANAHAAAAKKPEPKKEEPKKPEPKKEEPKKPEPKKEEPKKPEPKKPAPGQVPAIAPIQYDLNSAVNYQERDRVLKELRALLKKTPNANIQITGYADDSPYKQTNDDVASNRAKYLLKYLCLNGVPEKQLSSRGIGSPKQGSGNGNRKAVIQIRN